MGGNWHANCSFTFQSFVTSVRQKSYDEIGKINRGEMLFGRIHYYELCAGAQASLFTMRGQVEYKEVSDEGVQPKTI